MMLRRWRAAFATAAVLAAVLGGVVGVATPAGATPISGTVDAVGWWTSRPAAPMTDGGFEVALTPDGNPQSVSAIRVTVDKARLSKLNITLTESTSVGSAFSHIRICRAAPGFPAANPGALADAPKMDCNAPVVDLVHRTGAWDGDLRKMLPNGGSASLGFVGVRDGQTPVNLLVDITGVTIVGEGSLDDTDDAGNTTDTTEAAAATFDSDFGNTPAPSFDPDFTAGNGFGLLSPPATTAPPTTVSTIDPSLGGPTRFASTSHGGRGPSRPWLRLLFLTPLSALIGVGLVYARRQLSARGANFV